MHQARNEVLAAAIRFVRGALDTPGVRPQNSTN
jgi:hypothetical protein